MCWHQSQCQYVLQDNQGRYILFEDYIQSQPNQNNRGKQVQQQNLFKSNENQDFQLDGQVHLTSIQDIEQQLNRQDINMKLPKNDAKQKCYHEESEPDESIQENETHQNGQIKRSKMIKKESTHKDTRTPPQSTKNDPKSGEVQQDQRSCQNSARGRPHKDQQARRHLQISRQFNHIYEHYARLLIYFYMMKKQDDQDSHSLSLQLHQNAWINQATEIMNIDNFPKDTNLRGQCFLLHPNSLHFIFQFNKKKKVLRYSSQQIKFYFFAFLGKRGLLTSYIHNYICQYWTDIVCLLNEWTFQQNRTRKEAYGRRLYIQYQQEADRPSDTRSQLESELKADPSIAAYEVACYLKCCCDYFGIQISLPKKQ